MTVPLRLLVLVAGIASATPVSADAQTAQARTEVSVAENERSDTAVTRLHISKMTCATCTVTARVALKKLAGVYDAKVTYEDSLGVVRYDPRRLTSSQIAEHLTRATGYPAKVLPDTTVVRPPQTR